MGNDHFVNQSCLRVSDGIQDFAADVACDAGAVTCQRTLEQRLKEGLRGGGTVSCQADRSIWKDS